jgi:UDP-N-acetylglucosamine:LPS N-acetylglucosamine transferase
MIFQDPKKCKEELGFINKPLVLSFGGSLGAKQ